MIVNYRIFYTPLKTFNIFTCSKSIRRSKQALIGSEASKFGQVSCIVFSMSFG